MTPSDTELLDWMEEHRACVGHHKYTNKWYSRAGCKYNSVREAIIAAINETIPHIRASTTDSQAPLRETGIFSRTDKTQG